MGDYDDYREYDGDTAHDMWVDYTYQQNCGDYDDDYEDEEIEYIPVSRARSHSKPTNTIQKTYLRRDHSKAACKYRIERNTNKIILLETQIAKIDRKISIPTISKAKLEYFTEKKTKLQKTIEELNEEINEDCLNLDKMNLYAFIGILCWILLGIIILWVTS